MKRASLFTLCAFIFSIPLENVVVIPGFGTLCRAIGGLAAFVGILACWRMPVKRIEPFHKWVLAFIALAAVSLLWSKSEDDTLYRVSLYSQLFVMIWLLWQHTAASDIQSVMRSYIYGSMLASASTIINCLSGISYLGALTIDTRYAATGFDPNDIALTLAVGVPIAWYLGTKGSRLNRYFYRSYVLLAFMAAILTASRGGFLALCVALSSLLFVGGRLNRVKRVILFAVIVVGMAGLVSLAPTAGVNRLRTTSQELQTGTLSSRILIWRAGLRLFTAFPLLGVGAGAFRTSVVSEFGQEAVAHNTYLGILTELGIVGGFVFLCTVLACLRAVGRLPLTERRLWQITLLTLGVGVCSLTWEPNKNLWLLMGLAVAHASTVRRRSMTGYARQRRPLYERRGGFTSTEGGDGRGARRNEQDQMVTCS